MDRIATITGKIRPRTQSITAGHGQNICARIRGRILRNIIVVAGGVARRRHKQLTRRCGGIDHVFHRLRKSPAAPRVVRESRTLVDRVLERTDGIGDISAAPVIQKLERHQAHLPIHAGHADAVVARPADRPRDMRAVFIVVHRITARRQAITINPTRAVHVIDNTVAVIVNLITWDFARIDPHVRGEILVGIVNAGVDHRDNDIRAPGAIGRPDIGHGNIHTRNASVLTVVAKAPQLRKTGIIRNRRLAHPVVGFYVTDFRTRAQRAYRDIRIRKIGRPDHIGGNPPERVDLLGAHRCVKRRTSLARNTFAITDNPQIGVSFYTGGPGNFGASTRNTG